MNNVNRLKKMILVTVLGLQVMISSFAYAHTDGVRDVLVEAGLTLEQANLALSKIEGSPSPESPEELARKNIQWLRDQGVKDVVKVIIGFPGVVGYSIDRKLNPKVAWLRTHGVEDIAKVISNYPSILGLSIAKKLNPTVEWLRMHGVIDISRVLTFAPSLMGLSVAENFENKVRWLQEQGVEDVDRVLNKFIQILSLKIDDNLNRKVIWMRSKGLRNIGKMIEHSPVILGLSVSGNLEPTFLELTKEWGFTSSQIENDPMLLTASLKRLIDLRVFMSDLHQEFTKKAFRMSDIDLAQRKICAKNLSVEKLVKNLQTARVIDAARTASDLHPPALYDLTSSERSNLLHIFKSGLIITLMRSPQVLSKEAVNQVAKSCQRVL